MPRPFWAMARPVNASGGSVRPALLIPAALLVLLAGAYLATQGEPRDGRSFERVAPALPEAQRTDERVEVIRQVADRRLGLLEAAARVRVIYAGDPAFLDRLRAEWPTAADGELYARAVIRYVRAQLHRRPAERDTRVAELKAELAVRLSAGPLTLPE